MQLGFVGKLVRCFAVGGPEVYKQHLRWALKSINIPKLGLLEAQGFVEFGAL